MALGQNTFWVIVINGLAITPKNDCRYSKCFRSSEEANYYAVNMGYKEFEVVEIRA